MLPVLTPNEARIIGCLMEKSILTPDVYPLTLNSLTNACNQKSSRNPVMSLTPGVVQHTARELHAKQLIRIDENFKSGVEKYSHRFCNERLGEFQFDPAQYAIITLLLLRGPQTPGELRAHSGRLFAFEDNSAVVATLTKLIERDAGPLVTKLPRTAGRKDSEYMHLFSGPIDMEAIARDSPEIVANDSPQHDQISALEDRIRILEEAITELKARLDDTKNQ